MTTLKILKVKAHKNHQRLQTGGLTELSRVYPTLQRMHTLGFEGEHVWQFGTGQVALKTIANNMLSYASNLYQ